MARRHDITEASRWSWPWWSARLRTLLWVSVVTVLIWVYADTQVTSSEEVPVLIELTAGNRSDIVLLPYSNVRVTFTVSGSRASLARFAAKYSNATIPYRIPQKYEAGWNQAIPSRDILESLPELRELGLSFISAAPQALAGVHLDRLTRRQVPVQFSYTGAELKAPPEPVSVSVSIADSMWSKLSNKALKTVERNLSKEEPGKEITVEAEINPTIDSIPVQVDRRTVSFKVVIEAATAVKSLPVAVRVMAPEDWLHDGTWQKYALKSPETQEWRQGLDFTGPKEDIDKLKGEDVDAYIVLKEDDKKFVESWLTAPVQVNIRNGLNVKLVKAPTLQYKLVQTSPATTP